MFARTLLALTLCAAPALAAPPEAPMPRAIPVTFSPHDWHLWWDEDSAAQNRHELDFDALRRTVYGPFVCTQNLRADVFRLAARIAPMPRAVGVPSPHPMWYDPEVCSPEQLELWHRMNFDYLTRSRLGASQERVVRGETRTGAFLFSGSLNSDNGPRFQHTFVAFEKLAAREQLPLAEPVVCPPCPLPKIEVNPLLGTWYREFPGEVVALTVTHDEMKLRVTWAGENAGWATVTAQYTLTKDGLAFGAFTGGNGSAGFTDKMAVMMQMLMDAPFSFRFRFTSEGLMIHQLQTCRVLGDGDDVRYAGLYTRAKDDKVPAPVAKRETRASGEPTPPPSLVPVQMPPAAKPTLGAAVGGPIPPTAGTAIGAPLNEPVRPAALETRPAVLPPALDGPPPIPPARPNAPPDGLKGFADDAFGAMLRQSGVLPKPEPELLPVAPPAKKLANVGTWHREIGPMTCVVKIDAEHVTITTTVSGEENGKKMKQGIVVTGDYHLARDGTTLVGLVTGLDVILEGVTGKDAQMLDGLEDVAKLQKALAGQPFALTVRTYGEVLVIGDVRMGEHGFGEMAAMLAGRYKSGEPKAAEPKALPRATGANAPRIPMSDADEHARIKELLYESETTGPIGARKPKPGPDDLRQIQNEWRRFWFNDQPSKLTPERVRGGIY